MIANYETGSHLHLPLVDELEHVLKIVDPHLGGHHHHRVLTRVLCEHDLKVGRRCSQDHLVRLDRLRRLVLGVAANQGHVSEGLGDKHLVEHLDQVVLVVLPFQVEELARVVAAHLGDGRARTHGSAPGRSHRGALTGGRPTLAHLLSWHEILIPALSHRCAKLGSGYGGFAPSGGDSSQLLLLGC